MPKRTNERPAAEQQTVPLFDQAETRRFIRLPRDFDSDTPVDVISFVENVSCPGCGEPFEGNFYDYSQSQSFQDIVDPPRGEHQCPECGHLWASEMTGWTFFSEAG